MDEQKDQLVSTEIQPDTHSKPLELSISAILTKSWQYMLDNIGLVVLLYLLQLVVFFIPAGLILAAYLLMQDNLVPVIGIGIVLIVPTIYFSLRVTTATIYALIRIVGYHEKPTLGSAWEQAPPLIYPYFITSFVFGLIVLGGTLLLIVPGIIFWLMYCLAPLVAVDQKLSIGDALSESKRLTQGNRGAIAAYFLVFYLVEIAVSFMPFVGNIVSLIAALIMMFTLPYVYFALKQQKDH